MSWENNVRRVTPYTPGEQPKVRNVIKLNTNENPYPPSPRAAEVLSAFDPEELRLYPDPAASELVEAIAETLGVGNEQVFVGVGSDDVLAMAFLTFFNSDKPILFPDITYSFYDVWADLFRIPFVQLPLHEDYRIRPEDYRRENGGVIFPNPNAPTGALLPLSDVESIIAANPDSVVIVDEAYIDFGGETALPLLDRYENLLVVRTFSKSMSTAGLRIGYAVGCEKLIGYLNDVKFSFNSYTMNRLTIKMGAACMRDQEYFREITGKIIKTRERAVEKLTELGFYVLPSAANFVFASPPDGDAGRLFAWLKEHRVYVRYWNKPRIREFLRITIGSDIEMDRFFELLTEYFV